MPAGFHEVLLNMRMYMRTRRKEKRIQPTNNHFATVKGMATQPLGSWQAVKILFDQSLDVNMVVAV
jgi:hypothetical protein